MDIELIADTVAADVSFEEGASRLVGLMRMLQRLPELSGGWRGLNGKWLVDGEEAFIAAAREALSEEGAEIGMLSLVADSGLHLRADGVKAERYLFFGQFGRAQIMPTHIKLGFAADLASLNLIRRVISVMLEWGRIQHITVCDPYYAHMDSPLDPRRRGVGWAGWLPFSLASGQVSEAMVLEPLAEGTFLVSVVDWDANDGRSIPRAQALELQLNGLGVLPTFDDLGRGDWGRR